MRRAEASKKRRPSSAPWVLTDTGQARHRLVERREAPPPHQRGRRPHQPPGGADRKAPPKRVSQTRWRLPALHCLASAGTENRERAVPAPSKIKARERRSVGFARTD